MNLYNSWRPYYRPEMGSLFYIAPWTSFCMIGRCRKSPMAMRYLVIFIQEREDLMVMVRSASRLPPLVPSS